MGPHVLQSDSRTTLIPEPRPTDHSGCSARTAVAPAATGWQCFGRGASSLRALAHTHFSKKQSGIQPRAVLLSCPPSRRITSRLASVSLEQKAGLQLSSCSFSRKVPADGNAAKSPQGICGKFQFTLPVSL